MRVRKEDAGVLIWDYIGGGWCALIDVVKGRVIDVR
jgi:hypothetical protein